MVQYWLIAVGGGVLSASLYLSVVLGSAGAMLLAYLAQLPLFVAALGFGTVAGLTASGAGMGIVALAGGLLQRFRGDLRPAPEMAQLDLPVALPMGLGVALAAWLIADGVLGFIGRNVAMIFLVPFFYLGLAVVHAFARDSRFRGWM